MNILFTLSLVLIILFAIDVPHDLQAGFNAQVASKELHDIRIPFFKSRTEILQQQHSEDESGVDNEMVKLCGAVVSCIDDYEKATVYNRELNKGVVNFIEAFQRWINSVKEYEDQLTRRHNAPFGDVNNRELIMKQFESNTLFIVMTQLLDDGEKLINQDLAKGYKAFIILLGATLFIIIYFSIVIILFQRSTNRKHIIRAKNLDVTLRSIADAVIATDIHGNITCMNPEAERLTGWSFEEAKGHALSKVFRVTGEHSGESVDDLVEQIKHGKKIIVRAEDSMLIASNGNRYQIYKNGASIYDDSGTMIGIVLVFRDVTQTHELQNRLTVQAKCLQGVIETSMDCVIVTDELGMVKEWNPAAESMFGWSLKEISERPIVETIVPEEFREQHLSGIERLVNSNQSFVQAKRIESIALHKDGHKFPIELAMTSIQLESGWVFNAFIRDLTDKKYNENLIKKKDVLLRETQRVAKLGYWELDLANNTLEWSDEIFRIFELDPEVSKPSYELFISTVHPEDRDKVDVSYNESIKNKAPYNIVHRIVTSKGIKVVHEKCETTYDGAGHPVRSLGLVQDITERVNNLDELRLASTMFETHAGILVTKTDGTIIRVNPAFERMTGYSSKELVGNTPRMLRSGKHNKEFYRNIWKSITNDGMWLGEVWNKRKDGELFAEWQTIAAVKNELGEVTHYVGTSQDITERRQAELKIEHLAYHDDLTDLANRRLLHDRLHQSLTACKRRSEFGAVLLLDLDRFKDLNDSLGHSVGDEILRQVASRLKKLVRESDTVARLGGDEFVVLLSLAGENISEISLKVQLIAEKIRKCLSQPYQYSGGQCYSNVSIGINLFPENSEDIDDILKHADTALYRAKARGRNAVCFYQPNMQVEVDERLAIVDGLRNALINNEFVLHYQPQINAAGELIGTEALLRWSHPENGLISPDKFISVAEDTGLILDIGLWVMRQAARQISEWKAAGLCKQEHIRLAINVSPGQFRQPDFVSQVLRIFQQADVGLKCVELEVTESLLLDELDEVVDKMETLRSHGIRISIDDFGTGYSSLAYLRQLPLDQLKIDRSFIRDITENDNDMVVVETIISMASHLGLRVIAEGVENQQQLDSLIEKGCKSFQGYYFSKPLNAEDFSRYIRDKIERCLPCNS